MPDTAVTLQFGGQDVRFWLPMARVVEIERLCGDKSIVETYEALGSGIGLDRETGEPRFLGMGGARIRDIYEVIRCAAIGGGMSPNDAADLVREYVDGRPLAETAPVAWAILHAAVMGITLGSKKKEAADDQSPSERVTS